MTSVGTGDHYVKRKKPYSFVLHKLYIFENNKYVYVKHESRRLWKGRNRSKGRERQENEAMMNYMWHESRNGDQLWGRNGPARGGWDQRGTVRGQIKT